MDRLTRHDLKSDKFVQEVAQTVSYVEEHRGQVTKIGVLALALIAVAAGTWYFMKTRKEARQADLAAAIETYNSVVTAEQAPQVKSFPTQEERQKAIEKEVGAVATNYSGTEEGAIASYLLGVNAADQGKLDESERYLKAAAVDGGKDFSPLAKMVLADVYAAQGKTPEAEKLLREVIASPSSLASKEMATLDLARLISQSNPGEARKLLEPLRLETGSASRAAVQLLGELSQPK